MIHYSAEGKSMRLHVFTEPGKGSDQKMSVCKAKDTKVNWLPEVSR